MQDILELHFNQVEHAVFTFDLGFCFWVNANDDSNNLSLRLCGFSDLANDFFVIILNFIHYGCVRGPLGLAASHLFLPHSHSLVENTALSKFSMTPIDASQR